MVLINIKQLTQVRIVAHGLLVFFFVFFFSFFCCFFFIVVTCASNDFSHSSNSSAVAQYNTIVTYTCETGYEITGGYLNRTCKANGTWSGDAPVCSSQLLVYYARCCTSNV